MMNESEDKVKRKRKPNWSQDQLLLLAHCLHSFGKCICMI